MFFLVSTIKELDEIKSKVEEIDNSRNIIKHINGANKQAKSKLMEEYQKKCQECYDNLNDASLLCIDITDSSLENKSEILKKPLNFEEIFNGGNVPYYEVTDSNYQEFKSLNAIPSDASMEDLVSLFKASYHLGKMLFEAHRRADGMFGFGIDHEYLDYIIYLQKAIEEIYEKLYYSRKQARLDAIDKSNYTLSNVMNRIIKNMGLDEGSISRSELEVRYTNVVNKIEELKYELALVDHSLTEKHVINEKVSFEDAKEYYLMLNGFYESMLSDEEIKQQLL